MTRGPRQIVQMLNGATTECGGEVDIDLCIDGTLVLSCCLVASNLVCDVDVILGFDTMKRLGGVVISPDGSVSWGSKSCAVSLTSNVGFLSIEDSDFTAEFDGKKWTIEWKWHNGEPQLNNQCGQYAVPAECMDEYEAELDRWIANGWLVPHDIRKHGDVSGVIPLMVVSQPNKSKVRPVMGYRELNNYVESKPGHDTAVCQEKLREWRKLGAAASLLDLRKAYLQVHVSERLQRFQTVRYKGELYVMTRMGFGLNVAPKVMSKIVSTVLSQDPQVDMGTDHYIDDIFVNEKVVDVQRVRDVLLRHGLVTKDPEPLSNARVLGVRVKKSRNHQLVWSRDAELPRLSEDITKRELFSVCGKLVGHYPVAGWLRTACSFIKRSANDVGWDDSVSVATVDLMREVLGRVARDDPVRGVWNVQDTGNATVWCDASSLAIGCCLQVGEQVVEDCAWLRKDSAHINVAELEAAIKGVSLALKWKVKNLSLMTDSSSVYRWVSSVLEDTRMPKVNGLSEMIVKRRLEIINDLVIEYGIVLNVRLVQSERK